jgi:hypothetical protein
MASSGGAGGAGGAGGDGGDKDARGFRDLPDTIQAQIGLYLTPRERGRARYLGAQERVVFSTYPRLVYRIKSILTFKFNNVPSSFRAIKNFGIFTDAVGNLRVEDIRDFKPFSEDYVSVNRYIDRGAMEIYDRLPAEVAAQIGDNMQMVLFVNSLFAMRRNIVIQDFSSGLWPAEELRSELQSRRESAQPFSLVRVKRYDFDADYIRVILGVHPQFRVLGTLGAQDQVSNIRNLIGPSVTHEIITEKFRIEQMDPYEDLRQGGEGGAGDESGSAGGSGSGGGSGSEGRRPRKKIASSGGAGGDGDKDARGFRDLPDTIQAQIGLFLTPRERGRARYLGAQERVVFSTYPRLVYRIKNIFTFKFDSVPSSFRAIKNFGIFTDAVGNLRVEDIRDFKPLMDSPPFGAPLIPRFNIDTAAREIYERLPGEVAAQVGNVNMMILFVNELIFSSTGDRITDLTSGLWTAEELRSELQSRHESAQPFSLVRVKRYDLDNERIRVLLQRNPHFRVLGTLGAQDPVSNIRNLIRPSLTQQIITEKFRIEQMDPYEDLGTGEAGGAGAEYESEGGSGVGIPVAQREREEAEALQMAMQEERASGAGAGGGGGAGGGVGGSGSGRGSGSGGGSNSEGGSGSGGGGRKRRREGEK